MPMVQPDHNESGRLACAHICAGVCDSLFAPDGQGHQPLQMPSCASPLQDSGPDSQWHPEHEQSEPPSPAGGPSASTARLYSEVSDQQQQQQPCAGEGSHGAAAHDQVRDTGFKNHMRMFAKSSVMKTLKACAASFV